MRYLHLHAIFIFSFIYNLLGCSGSESQFDATEAAPVAMEESYEPAATDAEADGTDLERKLVKEGNITFETNDMQQRREIVAAAVSKYKAYVASDQTYNGGTRITNNMQIRIPAENFDAFLADVLQGVGNLDSKDIQVTDVTENYLDVAARLKTKKELESRYLELLKKANSVSDMLEIERQIGELRADIESYEGRLKYLDNRVSYTTLHLSFYKIMPNSPAFVQKFKRGFVNGWNNLIWFFILLANIWPFLLFILALFGFLVYRNRKNS